MNYQIKNNIKKNAVMQEINNSVPQVTIGQVLEADETNNVVSLQYVDKTGKASNKDNVTVRINGDGGGWFPKEGEMVTAEVSGDKVVVIARLFSNFNMDIRAKQQLVQDVYPDNYGGATGGCIY